jgi:hypothetical protein
MADETKGLWERLTCWLHSLASGRTACPNDAAVHGARPAAVVPRLAEMLSDGDASARLEAAGALGFGVSRGANISAAISGLAKMLSDDNPAIRLRGAEVLCKAAVFGADITAAMPALACALSDADAKVRGNAAGALGRAVGKCASLEILNRTETKLLEAHGALGAGCQSEKEGGHAGIGAACRGLMNEIANRRNELASPRDIILDGKPRPPKGGSVFQATRRALTNG